MESKGDDGAGVPPPEYRAAVEHEELAELSSSRAIPMEALVAHGAPALVEDEDFGAPPSVARSFGVTGPTLVEARPAAVPQDSLAADDGAVFHIDSHEVYRSAVTHLPQLDATELVAANLKVAPAPVAPTLEAFLPPALPEYPYPLDRSTCTVSQVTPLGLLDVVRGALATEGVDFEFVADKCKFKCTHYKKGLQTRFRVFLYTVSEEQFAVEFQCRAGDSYLYTCVKSVVYRAIDKAHKGCRQPYKCPGPKAGASKLLGPVLPASACLAPIKAPRSIADLLGACTSEPPSPKSEVPSVPTATDPPASMSAAAEEHMALVKGLVSAQDAEARSQGVRAIAVASEDHEMHGALVSAGVIAHLARSIGRDGDPTTGAKDVNDSDTRCFAVTAVANLAESRVCHEVVVQSKVVPTLVQLARETCSVDQAQLRREAARALANISATQQAAVLSAGGRAAADAIMKECRDPRTKLHATKALHALRT